MISLGTIFTIGAVAAIGAVGYAVYRNADKAGGALSKVVETKLTNPIGDYLDSIAAGVTGAGTDTTINPATIVNPLPVAHAATPGLETLLDPTEAAAIESKYVEKAQTSARMILESFAPGSQDLLIKSASDIATKSQTPITTQAHSIVDQARVSVGGAEPLTNKFYRLFTMQNQPAPGYGGKILPLSKESISFYASKGIIAREVYL